MRLLARLDSSLKRELTFINNQNDQIFRAVEERLFDPHSAERAKVWQPIIEAIQACAKSTSNHIDGFISMLDEGQAYNLFTKGPWGDSLYQLLFRFRQTSLHAHERLLEEFDNTIMLGLGKTVTISGSKNFVQQNFDRLTNEEVKAVLNYCKKEVALTENRLVTFCFNQIPSSFCGIDYITSLVSQSHSVLMPGERLTITAGIGSYSYRANPAIFINGQKVPLTNNAVAFYTLKIGQKKGSYSIPVFIEYIEPNGVKASRHVDIAYSVR
jgi:hypothetical protein